MRPEREPLAQAKMSSSGTSIHGNYAHLLVGFSVGLRRNILPDKAGNRPDQDILVNKCTVRATGGT